MDVRLPDGTVIRGVPDNITKAELAAKLKANGMAAPEVESEAPKGEPLSRADRFTKGLRDPIDGGAQLLTKMLPEGVVKAGNEFNNWLADKTGLVGRLPEGGVDQQVREAEKEYQARRGETGIDGYRLAGNVLSPTNLALAAKLPAAATMAGRVGVGAAGGAANAALNPVTQGGDFAKEKGKRILTGAAFGGAVPVAMQGVSRVINPAAANNPNVQLLKQEGVHPTVGQTLGGRWNALEEKLQSLPIMGDAIANARGRALKEFNEAAINRAAGKVGANVKGSGQGAVAEAGDVVSQAYDDALASVKHVRFDQQFGQDIRQLSGMAQNLLPEMRNRFNRVLKDVVGGRLSQAGAMGPKTFKDVDSEIGQMAATYRGSSVASEKELGDALTQLQTLLRAQAARNDPNFAKALSQADAGWANLVRVEGAAKAAKNNDGVFTPAQLNTAIQTADKSTRKRAVARGEALMQDLSNAGQNVLGNRVPNSFTTDRALIAGGALGSYLVNPAIPAGLLGGGLLYTPVGQGLLRAAVSSRPQAAGAVAGALEQAAPALVPLGSQVGLELLK